MKYQIDLQGTFKTNGYENFITTIVFDGNKNIVFEFLGWVILDKYKENAFITWKDNNSDLRIEKTIPYFKNRKRLSTIAKNILKKELNSYLQLQNS
jgi:hypothetical protein